MKKPIVRVRVENGVAYADPVPSGVILEVIDYGAVSFDKRNRAVRDEAGRRCSIIKFDGDDRTLMNLITENVKLNGGHLSIR